MRKVPLILQGEPTDCAHAAVAMVAAWHGVSLSVPQLRQRAANSDRGPTLDTLLALATTLEFDARALRVSVTELRQLRLPAILHWNFEHFVVLARVGRRRVSICDPAHGRRQVSYDELGRAFTGVAVELRPGMAFREVAGRSRPSLGAILRSYPGAGRYALLLLLLLGAIELLALAVPIASQVLIDSLTSGYDPDFLHRMLAGLGCVLLAMLLLDVLRRRTTLAVGIDLGIESAQALLRRLFAAPASRLERRSNADLLSRIDSLQPLQRALTESGVNACVRLMTLIISLLLMLYYSPLLTLVALAALLLSAATHAMLLPRTRSRSLDALIRMAAARQSLLETLRGLPIVENLGLQDRRLAHWRAAFVAGSNARAEQGRLGIAAAAGQGVIGIVEQLLFLLLGMRAVGRAELSLGALFALLALRGRMAAALGGFIVAGRELYLLGAHVDRVGELLEDLPEGVRRGAGLTENLQGDIRCEALGFVWSGGAVILDGFDAALPANHWTSITGPSGSGKSTLLRLLSLELSPTAGNLLYDGVDAELWDRDCLRAQFGSVRQRERLFAGSIADNLSGFAAEPDVRRLRQVAEVACIWPDIARLPMRLATPLADNAAGLSGGQIQRLLIARALYRKPRVLFLDEATRHLDPALERELLSNLKALPLTVICVAHGGEALQFCDQRLTLTHASGKSVAAIS